MINTEAPRNLEPDNKKKRPVIGTGAAAIGGAALLTAALVLSANIGGKGAEATKSTDPATGAAAVESLNPSTPTTGEAAASPTPNNSANYSQPGHFQPGAFANVETGDIVVSDIKVAPVGTPENAQGISGFARLYDTDTDKKSQMAGIPDSQIDNAKTGLITKFSQDAEVYFPYGGDVVRGIQNPDVWIANQVQDMENSGCVPATATSKGGCSEGVFVANFTGMDTTVAQDGKLAKDVLAMDNPNSASLTPSESPAPLASFNISALSPEDQILYQIQQELQNCLCEGKKASPAPSAEPIGQCPEDDHPMKQGDVYKLPEGDRAIVEADAIIDPKFDSKGNYIPGTGKRTYDNLAKTGAISQILDGKSHVIWTPVGGGDVQVFCSTTDTNTIHDWYIKDKNALEAGGRTLDPNSITIQ